MIDPDRFRNLSNPGAQEWWYFDAIADDGRDALVVVWYAGLPFDPEYGLATARHLNAPDRHQPPCPLDHCALGLSWYRDGKTLAYALNAYRRHDFRHRDDPFAVEVGGSHLERNADGYALMVRTPAVDGRRAIVADLRFRPAPATEPLEFDLGHDGSPHVWSLVAPDGRVEGQLAVGDRDAVFRGRGYHDHNAGSEEIRLAMRRWRWGRYHQGPWTQIYYQAEPRHGGVPRGEEARGLWITCREGRPVEVREDARFLETGRGGNVFGVRHGRSLRVSDGTSGFVDCRRTCVDDGPFYRRWVGPFEPFGAVGGAGALGLSELLDTRNLHRPLFNWMIPYRLKRPATTGALSP